MKRQISKLILTVVLCGLSFGANASAVTWLDFLGKDATQFLYRGTATVYHEMQFALMVDATNTQVLKTPKSTEYPNAFQTYTLLEDGSLEFKGSFRGNGAITKILKAVEKTETDDEIKWVFATENRSIVLTMIDANDILTIEVKMGGYTHANVVLPSKIDLSLLDEQL